jgi:hypothetical protein
VVLLLRFVSQTATVLLQQTRFLLELCEKARVGLAESLEFFLKGVDEGVAVYYFSRVGFALLLDVLLHDLAILEDEFKGLLEFNVLLLLAVVLLLPLLRPPRVEITLLLQFRVALDLLLKLLIGFRQLDLDEVDFLLRLLQVLLDAALVVGDLILQREQRVIRTVLAPHQIQI